MARCLFYTLCLFMTFPVCGMEKSSAEVVGLACMPSIVITHICEYLGDWYSVNQLGVTCKTLDGMVTIPGRALFINVFRKRENRSARDFLTSIAHIVQRMRVRGGSNPLNIELAWNRLSDDVWALDKFVQKISDPTIHVVALGLAANGLLRIPRAASSLQYLEVLDLGCNRLASFSCVILKNMPKLLTLSICSNNIKSLPSGISTLKNLRTIFLSYNKLKTKSLTVLFPLQELESLDVSGNKVPFDDLISVLFRWPHLKKVIARKIQRTSTPDIPPATPDGVVIYY